MCKESSAASEPLGCQIFPIRLSIRITLSAAHFIPNHSIGLHRQRGAEWSLLLIFAEIFLRLLDHMIPLRRLMKRDGDLAARAISLRVLLRQPPHVQCET
jgi:hypothetical protein